MLIAQAIAEDMVLVSADPMFKQYDVSMLWAAGTDDKL
jgi:PIN domain nuclease of toxin-antitoxin system